MTEQKRTLFTYFRSGFRFVRRSLFLVALLVSIAINGALLLSNAFLGAASVAVSALTGKSSLVTQQADDIARLQAENAAERKAHREARSELAETSGVLVSERRAREKATRELTTLSNASKSAKQAANEAAERVTRRTQRAAVRETTVMPAEAIPWLGTAVIVSATALELADMCATIQDMTSLQRALDPSIIAPPEEAEVCGMQVPTRKELWNAAKNAPAQAWEAGIEIMPTADELREIELSDIDWRGMGNAFAESAASWGSAAVDKGADLGAAASEKAQAGFEKLKHWWESD